MQSTKKSEAEKKHDKFIPIFSWLFVVAWSLFLCIFYLCPSHGCLVFIALERWILNAACECVSLVFFDAFIWLNASFLS